MLSHSLRITIRLTTETARLSSTKSFLYGRQRTEIISETGEFQRQPSVAELTAESQHCRVQTTGAETAAKTAPAFNMDAWLHRPLSFMGLSSRGNSIRCHPFPWLDRKLTMIFSFLALTALKPDVESVFNLGVRGMPTELRVRVAA